MRPTSVVLKPEHFSWLVEEISLHQPAWEVLRWIDQHTEMDGENLRIAPPEGDFEPVLAALAFIENELGAFNGLVRIHQEILAVDSDEVPPVVRHETAAMEAAVEKVVERADRVDILRNIVFFQVGPDFPDNG